MTRYDARHRDHPTTPSGASVGTRTLAVAGLVLVAVVLLLVTR